MKRDREYRGQPHTDHGERGRTEIRGITFRDLRDAYVRAWFLASGHLHPEKYQEACKGEDANLSEADLFGWNLDDVDPVAVAQNLSCEIERLMGIYPNVPELTAAEVMDQIPMVDLRDLPAALDDLDRGGDGKP